MHGAAFRSLKRAGPVNNFQTRQEGALLGQLRVRGIFDAILGGIRGDELGVFRGVFLEVHRAAIAAEVVDFAIVDGGELGVADIIAGDGALGVVQVDRGRLGGGGGVGGDQAR